jgi:hypothetical protein
MNWRRGLLLAGIHLAVALPVILMMEAKDAQFLQGRAESTAESQREDAPRKPAPANQAPPHEDAAQESETDTFDPCKMWVHYAPQHYIVQLANFPAFVLTAWREECPARWSLSGMLGVGSTWWPTPLSLVWQKQVDLGLALLIAMQWFFIGGFPLARPRRWCWEPGVFITLCTVAAFVLVLIPVFGALSKLPMLFAAVAWLYWFGLLLWKLLRLAWRLAARRMVHAD